MTLHICHVSFIAAQGFGYIVGLAGFFMYNYLKMKQLEQPQADSSQLLYTAVEDEQPNKIEC